jgi:hypothetical protein
MVNSTRAEMTSSSVSHGIAGMNGVVAPDKIECIYVNLFLFPFPAHDDAVGNVCKYTLAPVLVEVKNRFGLRGGQGAFVCANTCRLFAYRPGVIVGASRHRRRREQAIWSVVVEGRGGQRRRRAGARKQGGEGRMVWLVTVGEGGRGRVGGGEACVCRPHHAVGHKAELGP